MLMLPLPEPHGQLGLRHSRGQSCCLQFPHRMGAAFEDCSIPKIIAAPTTSKITSVITKSINAIHPCHHSLHRHGCRRSHLNH